MWYQVVNISARAPPRQVTVGISHSDSRRMTSFLTLTGESAPMTRRPTVRGHHLLLVRRWRPIPAPGHALAEPETVQSGMTMLEANRCGGWWRGKKHLVPIHRHPLALPAKLAIRARADGPAAAVAAAGRRALLERQQLLRAE